MKSNNLQSLSYTDFTILPSIRNYPFGADYFDGIYLSTNKDLLFEKLWPLVLKQMPQLGSYYYSTGVQEYRTEALLITEFDWEFAKAMDQLGLMAITTGNGQIHTATKDDPENSGCNLMLGKLKEIFQFH